MVSSKCPVCDSKRMNCIKDHEGSGLLSDFGVKAP